MDLINAWEYMVHLYGIKGLEDLYGRMKKATGTWLSWNRQKHISYVWCSRANLRIPAKEKDLELDMVLDRELVECISHIIRDRENCSRPL